METMILKGASFASTNGSWKVHRQALSLNSKLPKPRSLRAQSFARHCQSLPRNLLLCFFASWSFEISKVMGRLSFTHEPWQWKISPDPADKGLTRSSQFLLCSLCSLVLRCAPCTPCAFFLRRSKGQHCKHHQAHGPWLFVWSLMQHGHRSH